MKTGFRIVAALVVIAACAVRAPAPVGAHSRVVTAAATCASDAVTVEISNGTGAELHVPFARALVGSTDAIEGVTLVDGAGASLRLSTRGDAASAGGALVVTSAGVLAPECGAPAEIDLGPEPVSDADRRVEWPAIAARTISNLEAVGAYDALYALLHADARALVTPDQVACWYADFLTETTTAEATVLGVEFVRWTWGANGEAYDAAEIAYRQPYWVGGQREDRASVEHLVLADGVWRWFLGLDAAWLAALPATCAGVTAETTPETTDPSATTTPAAMMPEAPPDPA